VKKRQGFVSNSSSSSFVVAFPEIPETVDEMRMLLFGDNIRLTHPYDNISFSTRVIAEIVLNDLRGQEPLRLVEDVVDHLNGHVVFENGEVDYVNTDGMFIRPDGEEDYGAGDAYSWYLGYDSITNLDRLRTLPDGTKMPLFKFEYADESGTVGCAMEHGGIFDRLVHIQISNH